MIEHYWKFWQVDSYNIGKVARGPVIIQFW